VPPGDAPDGTGATVRAKGHGLLATLLAAVPVGESLIGAGGSPAPPIFKTGSQHGFKASQHIRLCVQTKKAQATCLGRGIKRIRGLLADGAVSGVSTEFHRGFRSRVYADNEGIKIGFPDDGLDRRTLQITTDACGVRGPVG